MKEIRLVGDIADKYGDEFLLDVSSPLDAIRALEANFNGFMKSMDESRCIVLMIDPSSEKNSCQFVGETAQQEWGNRVMVIFPEVNGDAAAVIAAITGVVASTTAGAIVATVVGGVLGGTVGMLVGAIVSVLINVAIYVAVSAVVGLIVQSIFAGGSSSTESEVNKPNYIFNGAVNTTKQGHRVSLLYGGPLLVGSMILSGRIITEDK